MRALTGTTPTALARRGIALDRLAVLTLQRDAGLGPASATQSLWLGERTQYRAAAAVLDLFDRPNGALGEGYSTLVSPALTITSSTAIPSAVSASGGVMAYTTVLARDQWAEATIGALSSATDVASVGVGVRWVANTGYLAAAIMAFGVGHVTLYRYNAGARTTLLDVTTSAWRAGDAVRLTAEWSRLRVYRNGTCLADLVDTSPLLVAGQAALHALRGDTGAAAAADSWVAGPLRQEYVGLVADLGDVTASLGLVEPTATPASWAMSLINLAPIGGAARFSSLLRHGTNSGTNTWDVYRAPITVAHAIAGGSVPLSIAHGQVDHAEGITESMLRLQCVGRDAFVVPDIRPGPVTYLPGPDPILTPAPIPVDPCGADAPLPTPDDAGTVPTEPPADTSDVATGPEADATDAAENGGPTPLLGLWMVVMAYKLGTVEGFDTYVSWSGTYGSGTELFEGKPSDQVPPNGWKGGDPVPPRSSGSAPALVWHQIRLMAEIERLAHSPDTGPTGSTAFPFYRQAVYLYRGPDVPGTSLVPDTLYPFPPGGDANFPTDGHQYVDLSGNLTSGPGIGIEVKLKRYSVGAIHTEADLAGLRWMGPSDVSDPFPSAIETIRTWSGTNVSLVDDDIALNAFTGPQLVGLEITPVAGFELETVNTVRRSTDLSKVSYAMLE